MHLHFCVLNSFKKKGRKEQCPLLPQDLHYSNDQKKRSTSSREYSQVSSMSPKDITSPA